MKRSLLSLLACATVSASVLCAAETTQPTAPELMPKLELKGFGENEALAPRPMKAQKVIQKAKPDLYSGRIIDAAMIYNSTWDNMSFSEVPYGLYKMNIGTGEATPVKTDPWTYGFYTGAYSETEFIGVRIASFMGVFNGLNFVSIDTQNNTENYSVMYSADEVDYTQLSSVMAYNPIEDKFYGINYNETMTGLFVAVFDPEAKKFERVGSWNARVQPLTMAYSPRGVCYIIASDGKLYTLDITAGDLTEVGATGVIPTLYTQGMSFDGVTGNFIWAAETIRGSRIYAVDPETAETEEIAVLAENQQFAAVHMPQNAAYYGAPAQVNSIGHNLYSGATEGTVSFTVPSTTFAGAKMSGDVNYTLWMDGKPLAENVRSQAGQYVNINVSTTEGNHVYSVITSNNIGDGPVKTQTYWAGYDYPIAPTGVTLATDENKQNFTAQWGSVYEGQHKGYVHWQITYNVYLMPDNIKVGDNLSGTTHTFEVPADMKRYYVEVAAVNSDGKEGARGKSGEILAGKASTVPFHEGFEDNTFTNLWGLFDNSGQDRTWRFGTGEIDYDGFGELWAVTPPISFDKSNKYQAIINMRKAWVGDGERVRVLIGKEGMTPDQFTELKIFDSLPTEFEDHYVDFLVEEDGDYELAFEAYLENGGNTLRFASFDVELIGKIGAPEEVTDIEIVPDADDALEATVTFTAPSKTLDEKTLSSISNIDILVDGQQLAKVENVTPGTKVTQKVTGIGTIGKHEFSFAPYNEIGLGKIAKKSQFIGCYTAPYDEPCDDPSVLEFWTAHYNFDTSSMIYNLPLYYDTYNKAIELQWFATAADEQAWAFSPDFKLNTESVYILDFDFENMHYGDDATYTLNIGRNTPESQQHLMDLPMQENYYKFGPVQVEIVIGEGGKYNFGFNAYSTKQYDNVGMEIRNIKLNYLTSAKAPYSVTGYKGVADVTGKLEADLTFTAPSVDFADRKLGSLDKIEILRNNGAVVKTFDNPAPGAEITWHDDTPNYGKNTYTIVAYNSEGRGKIYTAELFVGEDVPVVENVTLVGGDDNMSATLSWERAEFGANGGILMDEDMIYHVFKYDAVTGSYNFIDKVTGNSYDFPAIDKNDQDFYYYGVLPQNDINTGTPVILSVQLGKLYELPFAESFASGIPATGLWSIFSQNPYISWQPMNGFFEGYDAQDKDGGCVGFFNGTYYTQYNGDRLYSPKFKLDNTGTAELKFYVLNAREAGSEEYPYPALMRVGVSTDDSEFEIITKDEDMEFDGTDKNWKEYKIDLTPYAGTKHMRICFDGYTNGGHEVLYLDNITINGESSGVDDSFFGNAAAPEAKGMQGMIVVRNAEGFNVEVYNTAGMLVGNYVGEPMMALAYGKGIYLVRIGENTFKVQVK